MKFPDLFTPAQAAVVRDLSRRDREERDAGIRVDESLKAVAPSVAQLLYLLILQKSAKTIVEFGTSHGYSTIHLAAAAEKTGGRVYTVDAMPEKTAWATQNLETAGLLDRVTLMTADGTEFVDSLPEGIDFVLIDYGIREFMPVFPDLRARVAPGCVLFVDGGPDDYWESGHGAEFRTRLEDDPGFVVSLLPMQKRQLLAVRTAV